MSDDIDSECKITCPKCGLTSHNYNDVLHAFCGHCHVWLAASDVEIKAVLAARALKAKLDEFDRDGFMREARGGD